MKKSFWQVRWDEDRLGFHRAEANEFLVKHVDALTQGPGARVLVPLCGKTRDMTWLAAQGHQVVGVEFVEKATKRFFVDENIEYTEEEIDGTLVRSGGGVRLLASDFLKVTPALVGEIDAVYDRAAMIALPPESRPLYAAKLHELGAKRILAVTIEYDQSVLPGPPFSVDEAEMVRSFGEHYSIEMLKSHQTDRMPIRFAEAGLPTILECVRLMTAR